ncbi:MAG: transposase [Bacteroidetes bacterium]|nr:transposase [Bacteroidota bacterium]
MSLCPALSFFGVRKISDNARYYRNRAFNDWINGTKTEPVYLPAYSQNLNIIERLWKFMRKKIIE